MTVIGYARVSTTDQDLSIQEAALKAAGCEVIRAEKRSGTTTQGPRRAADGPRFHRQGRRADGHPYRSPGAQHRRSAGHRPRAQGQGREP